jgi:hypothetical protein
MHSFGCRTTIISLLVASLPAVVTAADRVTVKGSVLEGSIVNLNAAGVTFEPAGTKGTLTIKSEDIEAIETDAPYHVLHGEEEETVGRILELKEKAVLVGDSPETAQVIQVDEIFGVISHEKYDSSWLARTRAAWRYWNANFDLGYSAEDATTDTQSFSLGLGVTRKKAPTRYFLEGAYRYGTTKPKGEPQTRTKDNARGGLRGEYDVTERIYTFAAGTAEYDGIQRLSIRGVPKGGVGYNFYHVKDDEKERLIQGEVGLAWVYERYFDGDSQDYLAPAFGLRILTDLPYGSTFTWNTDYLPAFDDWTTKYLIRTEATLTAPLYDPLNLKLSVLDIYNNAPAPDTDRNSLTTIVGVSVVF